jgi:hypothetical protein
MNRSPLRTGMITLTSAGPIGRASPDPAGLPCHRTSKVGQRSVRPTRRRAARRPALRSTARVAECARRRSRRRRYRATGVNALATCLASSLPPRAADQAATTVAGSVSHRQNPMAPKTSLPRMRSVSRQRRSRRHRNGGPVTARARREYANGLLSSRVRMVPCSRGMRSGPYSPRPSSAHRAGSPRERPGCGDGYARPDVGARGEERLEGFARGYMPMAYNHSEAGRTGPSGPRCHPLCP